MVLAAAVSAQPQDRNVDALKTSIATDKPSYAAGEPIEIRVTITNPTDSSAVKVYSSGCISQFSLDGIPVSEYTACTLAIRPIEFPPYSALTVLWRVNPLDLGWPTQGGTHTLVGYSVGEPDTTTFEAPAAMGGQVYFRTVPGVTHADLGSLRDSLSAEILSEAVVSGRSVGEWRVHGAPLDTLVARYQTDARFDTFEALRFVLPVEEAFTGAERSPALLGLGLAVFPNPASETLELTISAPQPEGATVEVFDALGRRVVRETGWRGTARQLDVRHWPPGVYTIRVRTRESRAMQRISVTR